MPRKAIAFIFLSVAAACSDSPLAPTPVASDPPPEPVVVAAPLAAYRITFDATWSAETHPSDFPRNPHFSPLIGGIHRSTVTFWQEGAMASEGIRLMAERGRTTPLDTEVEAAIAAGHAQRVLGGGTIDNSPGSTSFDFEISRDFPLVTLVTMVAPSPDWFVGVSGLNLIENGDWVAQKVVSLRPWDAGTDSGVTFSSADVRTAPPDRIHLINSGPLVVGSSVPPMGTFTFRRIG